MQKLRAVVIVLVTLALVATDGARGARAQAGKGQLDLTAVAAQPDGSTLPLAGVTAILEDAAGAPPIYGLTDDAGEVHLQAPPGIYAVTLYRDGYDGAGRLVCGDSTWTYAGDVKRDGHTAEQEDGLELTADVPLCREYLFGATPPPPALPVHITFDDSYISLCSTVDLVIRQNIHATFFLTGQAILTHPDCVRRLLAAGNQLGNHTYAHENLTLLSRQQILTTLQRTEDAAQAVAGVSTRPLCRPPYGAINAFVRQVAAEWGCQMILWDRDTRDWSGLPASTIVATATSVICRGEVILLHTQAFAQDQFAVPSIVRTLRSRGCEPVLF